MTRKVLITGAAGQVGRALAAALPDLGYCLTLVDLVPFPGETPSAAQSVVCDLGDAAGIRKLAAKHDVVIHLAGISDEAGFEELMHANLRCTWHVFEAARSAGARVIFASSAHVAGFYERTARLNEFAPFKPDTLYGVSKIYGEALARLYWDKFGVECLVLRIGSFEPQPGDQRHLSTWLSLRALVGIVDAAIKAPDLGFLTVWGVSNNRRAWWRDRCSEQLQYERKDDAENFAGSIGDEATDEIGRRFQGGRFCSIGLADADEAKALLASDTDTHPVQRQKGP